MPLDIEAGVQQQTSLLEREQSTEGTSDTKIREKFTFERAQLQDLFEALRKRGYKLLGPTVRDKAIVYSEISSAADLPVGITDVQDAGTYRLQKRDDEALFGYAVGPQSWKQYLHPPLLRLWHADKNTEQSPAPTSYAVDNTEETPEKLAFIGVRSCELHAMGILDRVFISNMYTDPHYTIRRQNSFVVVVNCGQPGGTCFCASMGTGPKASGGFDLALTEVLEPDRHYFVVEVGSEQGAQVMQEVTHAPASMAEDIKAEEVVALAEQQMGRKLDTTNIKEILYRNYDNPRWLEVSQRCLTCANCTLVCPTCFCTGIEDVTDLAGQEAERWRSWDSCFTTGFSYIHGGSVRASASSRYRQWLTHKLASWEDQFGTLGCVGCGRCITWCPVGIDITEEARAIRDTDNATAEQAAVHADQK